VKPDSLNPELGRLNPWMINFRKLAVLAICISAVDGCGKKKATSETEIAQPTPEQAAQIESEYILPTNQAAAAAPSAGTPPQATPGAPQPVQPAVPIQQRLQGAIHAQLTIQLRRYIEKYGGMPTSFSEFVSSTMDTVPPAPDGMKFAIDPVDRTVKAVKK
jgi:hypothetical protein